MELSSNNPYEYRETSRGDRGEGGRAKFEGNGGILYEIYKSHWPQAWQVGMNRLIIMPVILCTAVPLCAALTFLAGLAGYFILEWTTDLSYDIKMGIAASFAGVAYLALLVIVSAGCSVLYLRLEMYSLRKLFAGPDVEPQEGAISCLFTAKPRQKHSWGRKTYLEADDIGWIKVEAEGIRFEGEHTKLFIPGNMIGELKFFTEYFRTAGMRRSRLSLQFAEDLPFNSCVFWIYSGRTIFESRRHSKELHEKIEAIATPYLM